MHGAKIKMLSWLKLLIKLLWLYLVGCLCYSIIDARSHKHQIQRHKVCFLFQFHSPVKVICACNGVFTLSMAFLLLFTIHAAFEHLPSPPLSVFQCRPKLCFSSPDVSHVFWYSFYVTVCWREGFSFLLRVLFWHCYSFLNHHVNFPLL